MKGKITQRYSRLINDDGSLTIELKDELSSKRFIKIKVSTENVFELLYGMSDVSCDFELTDVEKVGKILETDILRFELPEKIKTQRYNNDFDFNTEVLRCAKTILDIERPNEGWEIKPYLGSKNSFVQKDNKTFVNITIKRYI